MKKIWVQKRINDLIDRIRELEFINKKRPLTGEECTEYINSNREKKYWEERLREYMKEE